MSLATTPGTEREPTALPRWIAAIIIGAIALASLTALLWPLLNKPPTVTDAGVIRAQIEADGAAGRIGAIAPDFEWTGTDGQTLRLSSYRGKVVVVNFWATWCPPCREELPALQRVAASEASAIAPMMIAAIHRGSAVGSRSVPGAVATLIRRAAGN